MSNIRPGTRSNSLHLGTPQRRISDSRISRINKLFDAKLRDEVSVMSNNSTSVVNDICQPLQLTDDMTVKYNLLHASASPSSYEEDYEDEDNIQLTPKLRSKRSIVNLSQGNTPKTTISVPKRRQLKEKLGDPLPLLYLDESKNVDIGHDLEARWKNIISNSKVRQSSTDRVHSNDHVKPVKLNLPISTRTPKDGVSALEAQLKDTGEKLA